MVDAGVLLLDDLAEYPDPVGANSMWVYLHMSCQVRAVVRRLPAEV